MSKEYTEIISILKRDYPNLYKKASTEKHKRILASFYNISPETPSEEVLNRAMRLSENYLEPKNLNDFYALLFYAKAGDEGIRKTAYPQLPLVVSDDYDREFDIDKWAKLVYKIYDAVLKNEMSLDNAIDYYSGTLDKRSQEDFKFKKWIKYHLGGDNNKYAKKEEPMKKKSDYQFGLNGSSFYFPDTIPIPEDQDTPLKQKFDNEVDDAKKKEEIRQWKRKLDGAIRRIDKLIRDNKIENPEVTDELFNSLHEFNMTVQRAKNSITASDLTYRAANSFRKMGFDAGHEILSKTAQDMAEAPLDFEAPDTTPDESPADLMEEAAPVDAAPAEPAPVESTDPVERLYENTSGAKEGEYEKLSEDVDLVDAIAKLEEVAARLSDRRVIRLLAEFDIMLDKIGIASMFPELAESQSKLIDGYSYALVRVTKMLGMLSSGKSLGEISSARKTEMTNNVRKEVDKTFNPPQATQKGQKEEAIAEEFEEAPAPAPEAAPSENQELPPEV